MRILFVRPPPKMATLFGQKSEVLPGEDENAGSLSFFYQFDQTPALEMVASCVPEHHEVCMLGLREESENVLEREITAYQPDVVGVTCLFTCATNATLRTVQRIRDAAPDVFIILGGHAPSLSPEYFDTRHVVLPTRLPLEQFYQLCFELESDTVKTMRRLALIARARYHRASEGEL